jgi:hypothetical protein
MLMNIDSVGNYWHGDFELLFDADTSLAGNGRYFLALAMSSKNNELSRLAVDALIAAVGERRIGAHSYGEAMAQLLPTGVITFVRWSRGLRDTARTSSLHAWFVRHALSIVIAKSEISGTQQIPFLELILEIQAEHGFKMNDSLRVVLSQIKGGGKAAKLAKSIMACKLDPQMMSERAAAFQCLQSRLERCERWSGCREMSTSELS